MKSIWLLAALILFPLLATAESKSDNVGEILKKWDRELADQGKKDKDRLREEAIEHKSENDQKIFGTYVKVRQSTITALYNFLIFANKNKMDLPLEDDDPSKELADIFLAFVGDEKQFDEFVVNAKKTKFQDKPEHRASLNSLARVLKSQFAIRKELREALVKRIGDNRPESLANLAAFDASMDSHMKFVLDFTLHVLMIERDSDLAEHLKDERESLGRDMDLRIFDQAIDLIDEGAIIEKDPVASKAKIESLRENLRALPKKIDAVGADLKAISIAEVDEEIAAAEAAPPIPAPKSTPAAPAEIPADAPK